MSHQQPDERQASSLQQVLRDLIFMSEGTISGKLFAERAALSRYVLDKLQVEYEVETKSLEGVLRAVLEAVAKRARKDAFSYLEANESIRPSRTVPVFCAAASAEFLGFSGDEKGVEFLAFSELWHGHANLTWDEASKKEDNQSPARKRRLRAGAWVGLGGETAYDERPAYFSAFLKAVDKYLEDDTIRASLRAKLLSQEAAEEPLSLLPIESVPSSDATPSVANSQRRWKLWIALVAAATLVVTVGVWAVWPKGSEAAEPFTATVEPQADQCGVDWIVPRPPSQVDVSSRPPSSHIWTEWPAVADGVSAAPASVKLTLQGTSDFPVTLHNLYVTVRERKPPLSGTVLDAPCGSPGAYRAVQADLDADPPRTMPVFEPQLVPKGALPSAQTPITFPYKISKSDSEDFIVTAVTENCDCTWVIEIPWASSDRNGTMVIDDHGKPFRTSSGKNATPCTIDAAVQCKDRTSKNQAQPPVNCKIDDVRDAQEGSEAPLKDENVENASVLACASPYAVVTIIPKDMARGEQLLINFSTKPPTVLLRGAQDPQNNRQEPFSVKQAREAGVDVSGVEQALGGLKLFYSE